MKFHIYIIFIVPMGPLTLADFIGLDTFFFDFSMYFHSFNEISI